MSDRKEQSEQPALPVPGTMREPGFSHKRSAIKAIIFDCFGVVISDDFDDAYRSVGGDPDKDRDFITQAMHDSNSGKIPSSLAVMAEHLGITEESWHDAVNGGRVINHQLLKYAAKLKKNYKIAMLSNIGSAGVHRFFEPGILEKYFDPVVESGKIGYAKPEARAYETVADLLDVRLDECVFIDDRQEYIDGAIAIGMHAILYENLPQLKQELGKILA
jgi:FMN phosphatase YigB (HAD superfamily)